MKIADNYDWLKQYKVIYQFKPDDYLLNRRNLLDHDGVVQYEYGPPIGTAYVPASIAQYALLNYKEHEVSQDIAYKERFMKQVNYLLENYDNVPDDMAAYPYPFPWSNYQLDAGWYSGLAQALVISVLIRAYVLTQDPALLVHIKKVYRFMIMPVTDGGLLRYTPEGNVWIEEYPTAVPSLVLNGFVTIVFSLYEYSSLFADDADAARLYRNSLRSIKESLQYYDTGSWLKYDRYGDSFIVSRDYLKAQIVQMEQLFEITADEYFRKMALKWSSYLANGDLLSERKRSRIAERIEAIGNSDTVVVYGSGEHTDKLFEFTSLSNKKIQCIVESSPQKTDYRDIPVKSPEAIREIDPDVIVISSFRYQDEIASFLIDSLSYRGKVITLYTSGDFKPFY